MLGPTPLLLAILAPSASLHGQPVVPDAQVEANVLKALAGAPELAEEAITTRTVYGTVTLSGSVQDEARRRKAETLAANADGVKKVVDELQLSQDVSVAQVSDVAMPVSTGQAEQKSDQAAVPLVLQSDGTYAPAAREETQPQPAVAAEPRGSQPPISSPEPNVDPREGADQGPQAQPPVSPRPLPSGPGAYGRRPMYDPNAGGGPQSRYPGNGPNYPGYPQSGAPQRPYSQLPSQQTSGGQVAGQSVTVPGATLLRVRVNRGLSSDRSQPGTVFDGIVVNDVAAGGAIAIPRGAAVQGRVVEAQSSGVLKGRGEMSIELTQVTLGGRAYPIHSDLWAHHGGDKTIETVNKTAGFGAAGAVIGALAGGGIGAAVGGGIGAAAGLGSSASSGNGQVYIPSESVVTFHLAQEVTVATVSQEEMQRLAYGVAPGADQRLVRRPFYGYPRVFVGPGYYPGYYPRYYPGPYGPYGYPAY